MARGGGRWGGVGQQTLRLALSSALVASRRSPPASTSRRASTWQRFGKGQSGRCTPARIFEARPASDSSSGACVRKNPGSPTRLHMHARSFRSCIPRRISDRAPKTSQLRPRYRITVSACKVSSIIISSSSISSSPFLFHASWHSCMPLQPSATAWVGASISVPIAPNLLGRLPFLCGSQPELGVCMRRNMQQSAHGDHGKPKRGWQVLKTMPSA